MSTTPYTLPNRPMNPHFGSGVYRRRVRLDGTGQPGVVVAEMEDCNHAFRATLSHDGKRILEVKGEDIRTPLTTCHGAVGLLQALEGIELSAPLSEINRSVNPKGQCTHLYDLALLGLKHAQRGACVRVWDIAIPDEKDGPTLATAHLDGQRVLQWQIAQWRLQDAPYEGTSLAKGFAEWVLSQFEGEQQEAAFILQKGYLVANARKFDMSKLQGTPVTEYDAMLGACYSYSTGVIEGALRTLNATRDFTDCEEQLLQFR